MPKHARGRATVERTANDGSRAGLACRSKVWLECDGQLALSEWRIRLLEKTAETGSLARAAEAIGVPYRTAWAKLKDIESSLGVRLLATQSGGADGGGSELTPEAVELIARFRRVTAGLSALVAERFAAEFGDLLAPSDGAGGGRALPRVD
jgi:molybdate transport system regulatory protein